MADLPPKSPMSNKSFLGQILVDKKKISEQQLEKAVAKQQTRTGQGRLLGDILVNQGAISEGDLQDALANQSFAADLSAEDLERVSQLKNAIAAEPQNAEHRLQLAAVYQKAGALSQAMSELQAMVRLFPDNLRALHALAKTAVSADNWELAANTWQKAFQLAPDEAAKTGLVQARSTLGELALKRGNAVAAASQFQALLRMEPDNPTFLFHFAETYRLQDQATTALRYLLQASKIVAARPDGIGGRIYVAIAEIQLAANKREEGLLALQQATRFAVKDPKVYLYIGESLNGMGFVDKAAEAYLNALKHDRKLAQAHLALGRIFDDKGSRDKALPHYKAAVEAEPQNPIALCSLGQAYLDAGDKRTAQEYVMQGLRFGMDRPQVHLMAGNYFLEIGKFDDAIERYMKALDLDPSYLEARINMGAAFHRNGRLERAMREYQGALERNPKHLVALKNLAKIHEERGEAGEAAELYQQVIALDPKSMPVYQNLGNCYRRLGMVEQAIAMYETVLKVYPHNAETLLNVGVSYLEVGAVIKAIEALNLLVEVHPQYRAVGHYYLGRVYHANDQLNRAVEMLKLATREDPKLHDAHIQLGLVYQELGDHDRAYGCFEKAIKLAPDNVQAKRLQQKAAAMLDDDDE